MSYIYDFMSTLCRVSRSGISMKIFDLMGDLGDFLKNKVLFEIYIT